MKKTDLTMDDLQQAIHELGDRFPKFGDDDLFVLWFLRAYVTDIEDRAAEAITGGSNDKGVDALLIDDAARAVFIVQGKYREKIARKSEGRSEIIAFASLANLLHSWSDEGVQHFLSDADAAVAEIAQMTRPGGMSVHFVDGKDHDAYVEAGRHPLEFLKTDASMPLVGGCNRIRPLQFLTLFERHGFDIVHHRVNTSVVVDKQTRAAFAAPFRSMPLEMLTASGIILHARRR